MTCGYKITRIGWVCTIGNFITIGHTVAVTIGGQPSRRWNHGLTCQNKITKVVGIGTIGNFITVGYAVAVAIGSLPDWVGSIFISYCSIIYTRIGRVWIEGITGSITIGIHTTINRNAFGKVIASSSWIILIGCGRRSCSVGNCISILTYIYGTFQS